MCSFNPGMTRDQLPPWLAAGSILNRTSSASRPIRNPTTTESTAEGSSSENEEQQLIVTAVKMPVHNPVKRVSALVGYTCPGSVNRLRTAKIQPWN